MRRETQKAYRLWISLTKKLKTSYERVQRLEAELLKAKQDFNELIKIHDDVQGKYKSLAAYEEEEQY